MIICSVDIGSRNLSYSIIDFDLEEKTFTLIKPVFLYLSADKIGDRLLVIQKRFEKEIEDNLVELIVFENSKFHGKCAQDLNFVCGMMHFMAAVYDIPIRAISPTAVKKLLTGVGTAGKVEVDNAVKTYLTNPPATFENDHCSDSCGVGVAYCLKTYF